MKRKIFALVLTLSLLMGITMALSAMAAEEPETPVNILKNSSFEDVQSDGWSYESYNSTRVDAQETDGDSAADGRYYIKLPTNASKLYLSFADETLIKPNTNYKLSFYVRSSVANAGYVDFRFRMNGKDYCEYLKAKGEKYVNGLEYFRLSFGEERTEEAAKKEWFKVEMDLNSPPEANGFWMQLYNQSSSGDENLHVDNFSLVETGKPHNLVRNGDFECYSNTTLSQWYIGNPAQTSLVEETNGNRYFSGNQHATSSGKAGYVYQTVYLTPGRYELSFRYKQTQISDNYARVRLLLDNTAMTEEQKAAMPYIGQDVVVSPQHTLDTWETYKMWFEVADNNTVEGQHGYGLSLRVPTQWSYGTYCIDDVSVTPANESYVYYADTPSVITSAVSEAASSKKASDYGVAWTKGNPVNAVTECSAGTGENEGKKAVSAIGCYIPTSTEAETFTLATAVYEVDKNNNVKKLKDVYTVDGTATGGIPASVNNDFYVDALTGDEAYTYEIKSFIWNSASGMKPVANATRLTY